MKKETGISKIHYVEYVCEKQCKKVLIAIHGFAGDCESSTIYTIAQDLNKNNMSVVTFDLPCHGKDTNVNRLSVKQSLTYLDTIIKYVKSKYINIPISFFATSFGAFLLLNYISKKNEIYDKIILRAPAINMPGILANNILPMHNYSLDYLKNNIVNLGFVKELNIDYEFYLELLKYKLDSYNNTNHLFVIQGKKDGVVNYKENEVFYNKLCKNNFDIFYIENADHRFKNLGELESIVMYVNKLLT